MIKNKQYLISVTIIFNLVFGFLMLSTSYIKYQLFNMLILLNAIVNISLMFLLNYINPDVEDLIERLEVRKR